MRFLMYAKTNGVEELFYDSESVDSKKAIAQPNLKLELNKAGTLEFTILPTHPMYNSFKALKTYIRVMQDDAEIFRGRVLKIKDSIWLERDIQCEGDLAYLIDSFQTPQEQTGSNTTSSTTKSNSDYRSRYGGHVESKSMTVQSLSLGSVSNTRSQLATQFNYYIGQHNSQLEVEKRFTVGNVTVVDVGTVSFTSTSYRDTKNAIDSDLIDRYGGYLQTRKNPNGPTFIDWLKEPGIVSTQRIILGVNLIDLQQESEGDELFTIFVPIGESNLTIASVNNGNIGIEDTAKVAKYGRIYKTQSYNGIKDPEELMKLGQDYMAANCKPEKLSLTIKAIDMNLLDGNIDAIKVGSTVTVVSDPHDIELSLTCISIEYDIQNPENNSYEIGDASETLSHKAQLANSATAEATSAARSRASWASSASSALEDTLRRHAQNIIDQADLTYKLEADLVQVHAKCIEITAEEKVTVTADTLELNTRGTINVTAGGVISMASSAQINFNDTLYIGSGIDDYTFYNLGAAWMQELTIGGHLYVADIEDENGAKWTNTSSLRDFISMFSSSFVYTGLGDEQNLENAIKTFGTGSADSSGLVSIPYYTFAGGNTKAGDITFNMADTAWYIARAINSLLATQEGITSQTGNTVSAVFRLHAKNADGDDITSATQLISLDYVGGTVASVTANQEGLTTQSGNTVSAVFRLHAKNSEGDDLTSNTQLISLEFENLSIGDLLATQEGLTTQSGNVVSAVFRLHAKDSEGNDITSRTQTISLEFEGVDDLLATQEGLTTQSGNTVSAVFRLHAKDSEGNDITSKTQTISLEFEGVDDLLATQEGLTAQSGNTVSAVFRLHAKDSEGNDITSKTQTISLDFTDPTINRLTATQEGLTTQSGNTVSAVFRLHAKDENGDDITSGTQTISLDFTSITIDRLTATQEGLTTQSGNTVSAVFRLHAKDSEGNDITSRTQTISLDFENVTINSVQKSGTTYYSDNYKTVFIPTTATASNGETMSIDISSSIERAYKVAYEEGWKDALADVVLDPNSDTTISSERYVYAKAHLTPDASGLSTLRSVKITPSGSSGGGGSSGGPLNFRASPGGTVLARIPNDTALTSVSNGVDFSFKWMPCKYSVNGTLTAGYVDAAYIMYTNAYKNRKNGTSYTVTNSAPPTPYSYASACLVDTT